jgi:hypothetical protein
MGNGAGFMEQDKKSRLKSVFGIVGIAKHATADAENHWTMPPHERFEGARVLVFEEPAEQGAVVLQVTRLSPRKPAQVAE